MFFHVHYLQVYAITLFLLQFGVISTCKFYKDHELKMYSCLLTPNCTRNRAYIYNMYMYIYIKILLCFNFLLFYLLNMLYIIFK